jgi:hypothetical protein
MLLSEPPLRYHQSGVTLHIPDFMHPCEPMLAYRLRNRAQRVWVCVFVSTPEVSSLPLLWRIDTLPNITFRGTNLKLKHVGKSRHYKTK